MGPTIAGLDSLLQMPTGCGEQTMVNLAPNVYVTDYLKSVNQLSADIRTKALNFMESGYQRELTYKHTDGSFSAFGNRDASGSMWLTAFVTRVFKQAKTHIYIDDEILIKAVQWMVSKQNDDGSFPEPGEVLNKNMQGQAGSGVGLSLYVLISLFENKDVLANTHVIFLILNVFTTCYLSQLLDVFTTCYLSPLLNVFTTCYLSSLLNVFTTCNLSPLLDVFTTCYLSPLLDVFTTCYLSPLLDVFTTCYLSPLLDVFTTCYLSPLLDVFTTCYLSPLLDVFTTCCLSPLLNVFTTCYLSPLLDVFTTCCLSPLLNVFTTCYLSPLLDVFTTCYLSPLLDVFTTCYLSPLLNVFTTCYLSPLLDVFTTCYLSPLLNVFTTCYLSPLLDVFTTCYLSPLLNVFTTCYLSPLLNVFTNCYLSPLLNVFTTCYLSPLLDVFTTCYLLVDEARQKALAYVEQEVAKTDDLYILTMAAYAFQLAYSSQVQTVLNKLEQKATVKDGRKHWHQPDQPKTTNTWDYPNPTKAVDIEMTSYALLTYAARGNIVAGKSIMQWLTEQRNSNGGFSSTQDTVVALNALSEFAKQTYSNNFNVQITTQLNATSYTFNIDKTNSLLLQSRETPDVPSQVKIDATGSGMALVQVAVSFNVESEIFETTFDLTVKLIEETINHLFVETCA
ncbi:BgTEP2.p1, partial [Biomphalaria glabrata]